MRKRFIYYLPRPGCSEKALQDLGIYDRFLEGTELGPWVVRQWEKGPDGKSGCLVASGERPPEYDANKQTWINCDGYWIGTEGSAALPGPRDLARPSQIDGYEVLLGDGNHWLIPVVWRWNVVKLEHEDALPVSWKPSFQNGKPKYQPEVISFYKPHVSIAEKVWQSFIDHKSIPMEEACDDFTKILAINYKLGPGEVGLLGLLNDTLELVLSTIVDMPAIQKHAEFGINQNIIDGDQSYQGDVMDVLPKPISEEVADGG